MKIVPNILALLALVVTPFISAQDTEFTKLSLEDAVKKTLAQHPELQSYRLQQQALQAQAIGAQLKPELRLSAGVEEFAGTGELQDLGAAEASISLSSVIELGEKRTARVAVARRRVELLDAKLRTQEIDLTSQVIERYINVASAQAMLGLQQDIHQLAQQTIDSIQALVTAGRAPQLELNRAKAQLILAEQALHSAKASLSNAKLTLSSMWNDLSPNFSGVDVDLFQVGDVGNINTLLIALENSPDLELFAHETRLRAAQLKQAESQAVLDMHWSAGVRHLRELNDTGFAVDLSIGLNAKSRAQSGIRSANANLQEVSARRELALRQLSTQLLTSHAALKVAIEQSNSLQNQVVPLLESVMTQTRQGYEDGNYSYLQLRSSQSEYLDAQLALINSASSAHKLRAEIERLSGQAL